MPKGPRFHDVEGISCEDEVRVRGVITTHANCDVH